MPLLRLVYCSKISIQTDPSEISKIHEKAQSNNAKLELSGLLLFGDDFFLQCLEGRRDIVSQLYCKIIKDDRHNDVQIISCEECDQRLFEDWSMKLVLLTKAKKLLIRKFTATGEFNPYEMSSSSSLKLLLALRAISA